MTNPTPGRPQEVDQQELTALLEEAQMVLPGLQAVFGFQLIAVFNESFKRLTEVQKLIHFSALSATLLAATVVMTPAAYHRLAEKWRASEGFVAVSSRLVAAAMAIFACGTTLQMWLMTALIFDSEWLPVAAAAATSTIAGFLWFLYPLLRQRQ